MTLRLHIESLSLTGVEISRRQRPQLQAALAAELSRLFTVHGVPESMQRGGRIPQLPANLTLTKQLSPTELGQAIAQSIYTDLNPQGMHHGSTAPTAARTPDPGTSDLKASTASATPGTGGGRE